MHKIEEQHPYLTKGELEKLAEASSFVQLKKGRTIIEYGDYDPHCYYILDGLVRGYNYTDKDQEYNFFFTDPQHIILSPDLFLHNNKLTNTFVFESITPIELWKINYDTLLELASKNPGIFEFYHKMLKQIIHNFFDRVKLLLIENAEERYLHLQNTRPLVVAKAQKKHLAQFLGITPNSFSRLLRKINMD